MSGASRRPRCVSFSSARPSPPEGAPVVDERNGLIRPDHESYNGVVKTFEMIPCRVLVDGPLSGERNMAVDAMLLDSAVAGRCTVRFYEWSEPTVSLGHFQSTDAVPLSLAHLPRVRRLSGGGAILHHHELTYSCALPSAHPVTTHPGSLYDRIHEAIIHTVAAFGVNCHLRGVEVFSDQPFLCFGRGDARDIVIGSHKIVGSAQRRRQGAVLQHGSILLAHSPDASEFPGILELTNVELKAEILVPRLLEAISLQLGLTVDAPLGQPEP